MQISVCHKIWHVNKIWHHLWIHPKTVRISIDGERLSALPLIIWNIRKFCIDFSFTVKFFSETEIFNALHPGFEFPAFSMHKHCALCMCMDVSWFKTLIKCNYIHQPCWIVCKNTSQSNPLYKSSKMSDFEERASMYLSTQSDIWNFILVCNEPFRKKWNGKFYTFNSRTASSFGFCYFIDYF